MNAMPPPSDRTRVRRLPKRGHYDAATVHAILDAAIHCHVGYVVDGAPRVTPTAHWREGDRVYWHGSSASRMLRTLERGVDACLTVTHLDGFVMARSGFHHSMNYRSVMVFGRAVKLADDAKLAALEAFTERLFPGRWAELRPTTGQELKATTVLSMPLDEASAKIRTGDPADDDEDYALPVWAGVLPARMVYGAPVPDGRLAVGTPLPAYLRDIDGMPLG